MTLLCRLFMLASQQRAKQLVCHAALADVIAGLRSCGSTWQEIDSKIGSLILADYIEELRKDWLHFIYAKAREAPRGRGGERCETSMAFASHSIPL